MDITVNKILTISIAAYNVEKTIRRTLDSLPLDAPCAEKMEVIIVNDGSEDSTLQIANEYASRFPNVVKVVDKTNGGYGSTVNSSSKIAKGKYFRLLDGDDWYIKENMDGFISFLEKCDSDVVITPFYEINEKNGTSRYIAHHDSIPGETLDIARTHFNGDVLMHGMTVRTDLWRNVKFQLTEHCLYTDNEFTAIALMNAETISRFDDPIYCYAIGIEGQSISIDSMKKHYIDYIVVSKILLEYASKNDACDSIKEVIDKKIIELINTVFTSCMIADNPNERLAQLKDFDAFIKQTDKEIYWRTGKIKKIAMARTLGFAGYGIACRSFKAAERKRM